MKLLIHNNQNQTAKRVLLFLVIGTTALILCVAFIFQLADGVLSGYKIAFHKKGSEGHDNNGKPIRDEYRILTSLRNHLGHFNGFIIKDLEHGTILNPTIIDLPRGAKHEFLVISRILHVEKEIGDKTYKLGRQLAFFANMTHDKFENPRITADSWSKVLLEEYEDKVGPAHHCAKEPGMDKYIGAEDMKLFWTRRREPLLIFTHQVDDPILCEGMFLIDARAAVPELNEVLNDSVDHMPAIRFSEPTLLYRQPPEDEKDDPRYQREKNWAPVQSIFNDDDELMFMTDPSSLYEWKSHEDPLDKVDMKTESAIEGPYPPSAASRWSSSGTTWHSESKTCVHDAWRTDHRIHQSTPMLTVTLCKRGECEPTPGNTVMIGMVQRRSDPASGYPYTWYDHRIAAYEAAYPYRMVSVSRMLTYHGETRGEYTWTGSMAYHVDSKDLPRDRSHGFLDDEIWLGFGIDDHKAGWLDVLASDLVQEHFMCEEAGDEYRKAIKKQKLDRWHHRTEPISE